MFGKKKSKLLITVSKVAEKFDIKASEMNLILNSLEWCEKSGNWWVLLEKGEKIGGKEDYNKSTKSKFIRWPESILEHKELIKAVEAYKAKNGTDKEKSSPSNQKVPKEKKKISNQEKKEKGDRYESFIADHYRARGYTIAEHGKDNGVEDKGIDIIAKKDKELLFIQCKNWSSNSSAKVTADHMRITRQRVREYFEKNPMFMAAGYSNKILYIMAEDVLHKSAYHYIEEHNALIDFRIIPLIEL